MMSSDGGSSLVYAESTGQMKLGVAVTRCNWAAVAIPVSPGEEWQETLRSAGFGDGGATLGLEEAAVDDDVEVDGVACAMHDEFEDLLFGGARWAVAEDRDVGVSADLGEGADA